MDNFVDKLSGNVCFFYHFSILDISSITRSSANATIATARTNLSSKYKYLYTDKKDSPILNEIDISQNFLHPNGLPFRPERSIIGDFTISHDTLPITDSTIMFTIFPEIGTASISINFNFKDASTDQAVFFRHCSGNAEKFKVQNKNGTCEMLAIKEMFAKILNTLSIPSDAFNTSYLIEINEFGNASNLSQAIEEQAERVYGLLTGDEGWPFVSRDLALNRISNHWGSRKFVNFIAFGPNFVLFNLNNSIVEKEYELHQKEFSNEYYNSSNDYFLLKSRFAGVNHGVLFSIETVMSIRTITKYILDKQTFFKAHNVENFNAAIKRTKAYRKDLMLTLNKLEQLDISELGELENVVLKSQNIDPIVEKIKYLLELLESDLTLMYSQQTNKMVNFLTIFGLILTIVGTIISYIDLSL